MKKRIVAATLAVCMLFGTTLPVFAQEPAQETPVQTEAPAEEKSTGESADPTPSPEPSESPEPSATPEPSESPEPTETPVPENKITKFEALSEDEAVLLYDYKPSLDEVLAEMPAAIRVHLDEAEETTELPVTWAYVGDDFDTDLAVNYTFAPDWDRDTYPLADALTEEDAPTLEVALEFDENGRLKVSEEGTRSAKDLFALLQDKLSDLGDVSNSVYCGILANMYMESGYNPEAEVVDTNGLISFGLCQWNGARYTNLVNYCNENGYDYKKAEDQIRFMRHELRNGLSKAWDKVKDSSDNADGAYDAGYNWAKYYEIGAESGWTSRAKYARDTLWPKFKNTYGTLSAPSFESIYNDAANGIKLEWKAESHADAYQIYRQKDSEGWVLIADMVTGTSYTDQYASKNVLYSYAIKSRRGSGSSAVYSGNSNTKTMIRIDPVAINTARNVKSGIELKWEWRNGATSYHVYRRLAGASDWDLITTTNQGTQTLIDTNVSVGKTYEYSVRVVVNKNNKDYRSDYSSVAKVVRPTAPTISSVTRSGNVLTVKWSKASNVDGYYVYRSEDGAAWAKIAKIASASTLSYQNSGVSGGHVYRYRISAYQSSYETGYSAIKTYTFLTKPVMSQPENTQSGIQVKWSAVSGASAYQLYRRTSTSGSWTKIATPPSTTYTDTGLSTGTTYQYMVRAMTSDNCFSDYASYKSLVRLTAPVMSVLTRSSAGVSVKWSSVSGSTSYILQRRVGEGVWVTYKTVSTNSYVDSAVSVGHTYQYRVYAVNNGNKSLVSNTKSIMYLYKPTISTATNVAGGISLKWNAIGSADKYMVYRRVVGTSTYTRIATVTTTTMLDVNVTSGVKYQYIVRANKDNSYSDYSAAKTATRLSTPIIQAYSRSTVTGLKVSWTKVAGATGYKVYRQKDNGSWVCIATVNSGSRLYYYDNDDSIQKGYGHYFSYKVRAVDGGSTGAFSAQRDYRFLSTPRNVKISTNANGVTLKWDAVYKADNYTVYRRVAGTSNYTRVGITDDTVLVDTNVKSGVKYQYILRAGAGGAFSNYTAISAITAK